MYRDQDAVARTHVDGTANFVSGVSSCARSPLISRRSATQYTRLLDSKILSASKLAPLATSIPCATLARIQFRERCRSWAQLQTRKSTHRFHHTKAAIARGSQRQLRIGHGRTQRRDLHGHRLKTKWAYKLYLSFLLLPHYNSPAPPALLYSKESNYYRKPRPEEDMKRIAIEASIAWRELNAICDTYYTFATICGSRRHLDDPPQIGSPLSAFRFSIAELGVSQSHC